VMIACSEPVIHTTSTGHSLQSDSVGDMQTGFDGTAHTPRYNGKDGKVTPRGVLDFQMRKKQRHTNSHPPRLPHPTNNNRRQSKPRRACVCACVRRDC
jgi:hypothetical protein